MGATESPNMVSVEVAPSARNVWLSCSRVMVLEREDGTAVLRFVCAKPPEGRVCGYCGGPFEKDDHLEKCRKQQNAIRRAHGAPELVA